MRLLLDTHAFLWFLREPDKIPSHVLAAIEATGLEAAVSIASLWEIAIKSSLNKLYLPKAYDELFPQAVTDSGLSLLPIEPEHLSALVHLPYHHGDPFDRLLIAQALAEGMTLVSRDQHFSSYGVPLSW